MVKRRIPQGAGERVSKPRSDRARLTTGEILARIEHWIPSESAASWDNVGLLIGDSKARTRGAVVSVDLTSESIQKAKALGYDLIVTHHPCIFPKGKGPSRLTSESLVYQAIREGVSVIAAHTNFDRSALEPLESLVSDLGAYPVGRLLDPEDTALLKLVVFVPVDHVEKVSAAICAAGAGHIGDYDSCTFATPGEGSFRGLAGTRPFVGKTGRLERAQEQRLETILPSGLKTPILKALQASHPYEEIAYDLYALEQQPAQVGWTKGLGYGFVAEWTKPRAFSDLARNVRNLFATDGFLLSGPLSQSRSKTGGSVRKIGFVPGKGSSFVRAASKLGCDLFLTGEVGYHSAQEAARMGLSVMEIGHRESERYFLRGMTGWLKKQGLSAVELNQPTQRFGR